MQYDAIVIGAGHNGLATSAYLSKKGQRVLCLEKNISAGGLAGSFEIAPGVKSPGIFHDTTLLKPEVIKDLRLLDHGLELESKDSDPGIYFTNGSEGFYWYTDCNRTRAEIADKLGHDEAERFTVFMEFIEGCRPLVQRVCNNPLPDLHDLNLSSLWQLGRHAATLRLMGKKSMTELMRAAPMCIADVLNEYFENDTLKACLASAAVGGTYLAPWSPGSGANLLLWLCRRNQPIKGGASNLIDALERAAKAYGSKIEYQKTVQEIMIADHTVKGVKLANGEEVFAKKVYSSCDPKSTFLKMIPPQKISSKTTKHFDDFRMRGTTAKLNLALKTPLTFKNNTNESAAYSIMANHLDYVEKAFDPVKYGKLPENPVLEVYQSNNNQQHSCSILIHYVPHELRESWNETSKSKLTKNVLQTLSNYCEPIEGEIIHQQLLSPEDLENNFGLWGGQIFHGEPGLDQLACRPTPETSNYKTPIENLILCGSGVHPGGGITCGPAYMAVKH